MWLLVALLSRQYVGSFLAVRARVDVDPWSKRAHLELCGAPVGGCLRGHATRRAGSSAVVLDPVLEKALRRRLVRVLRVDRNGVGLVVRVALPALGEQTLALRPVAHATPTGGSIATKAVLFLLLCLVAALGCALSR